ncbi:hypothetical protein ATANTOWER_014175 [Ataeniobius toweri]|uniref:Uncharacterized protein n=1 Tax=Ataeniobius toweri TaxID=208326 RepID=A0ABU7AXT2_9TELE|nr:hypothetical protein [Ataeniobius toweri]
MADGKKKKSGRDVVMLRFQRDLKSCGRERERDDVTASCVSTVDRITETRKGSIRKAWVIYRRAEASKQTHGLGKGSRSWDRSWSRSRSQKPGRKSDESKARSPLTLHRCRPGF